MMSARIANADDEPMPAPGRLAETPEQRVDPFVTRAEDANVQDQSETDDWRTSMAELLERVQARIPPWITPEEIEAGITAAREEVWQARRASRGC